MSVVDYATDGAVAVITLDRPPVNALSVDLIEELGQVDGTWRVRLRGCEEPLTVSRRLERAVKAKVDERQGRFST